MMNNLKILSIFCLVFFSTVNAVEEKIIKQPNDFFQKLLMVNCSSPGTKFTFCYPDQKVNPNDYLADAECPESTPESGEEITYEEKKTCSSLENGEESCDVELIPIRSECVLKDRNLKEKILDCESKYQAFLKSNLGDELKGLNISFSNSVTYPEFLFNALPTEYQSRKSDILLLPDHDFGAFCNEQGEFDYEKSKRELQKIKGLIYEIDFLDYEEAAKQGLQQVADVLSNSHELDVINFQCKPNGVAHAEIVGHHYRIEKEEQRPKEKIEQPKEKVSLACLSSGVESLLQFHQSHIDKALSSNEQSEVPPGMYKMPGTNGGRLKQIPYVAPYGTHHLYKKVKTLCHELEDEEVRISESGITIEGRKIPRLPGMFEGGYFDPKKELPRYEKVARDFVNQINEERVEEGIDPLDGTYILELMGVQMHLEMVRKTKAESEIVAPEGKYLGYNMCTNSFEVINEDEIFIYLSPGKCEVAPAPEMLPGFEGNIMDLPTPIDMSGNNIEEYEIIEDGDGDYIYEEVLNDEEDQYYEDTGGY